MPIRMMQPWFLLFWLLIPLIWIRLKRSSFGHEPFKKRLLFGVLHTALVLLLGLSLADPRLQKSSDQVNLFFCLDLSESIGRQGEREARQFIDRAVKEMQAEDRAGLIVFGKEPSLESGLQRELDPFQESSRVNRNFTDLYKTLQLAVGKLPQSGQNRIVLLSDGNENLDQAAEMALLAKALNIQIFSVPLTSWFQRNEVYVEKLEAPQIAALDAPFEIRLAVISTQASKGELLLFRNDQILTTRSLDLQPGKNVFTLKEVLKKQGLFHYRALVNAARDTLFQNNEGLAFVQVARKGNALYVSDKASTPLSLALTAQGMGLVRMPAERMPRFLYELDPFDAIILDNADGQKIPYQSMEAVENYVKDLGGGLIMIGGESSFGAGHYLKTPVENALPVYVDVPSDLEMSGICMVLVVDKSSSMTATFNEKSKLEMSKIAAFSTVELLNPVDSVGIVAFDTAFKWIVPITRVTQRTEIARRLSELKEGGGTDLYPALKDVHHVLKDVRAAKKHVIVLTDGMTEKANFKPLVQGMLADRISISTVAVGEGADIVLLRNIAQWGSGRAYYTADPNSIPRIFTDETKIVAKKLIVEKHMTPRIRNAADILKGFSDSVPAIDGQVKTFAKPDSQILIDTEEGPLLAVAQYGLGRSVAFTSDLSGRWSKDWVLWNQYGRFVAQMVRWAQKQSATGNFETLIRKKGGQGELTVDILNPQNDFVNELDLSLKVLLPSGRDLVFPISQTAPGRYQGSFPAEEIGDYYLNLYETDPENAVFTHLFGYGVPYTEEYVNRDVNLELLSHLATLTSGKVLDPGAKDLSNLFKADADTKEYGRSLWPFLVLLFLCGLVGVAVLRKFGTD